MYINKELLLSDLRQLPEDKLQEKGLAALQAIAMVQINPSSAPQHIYAAAEAMAIVGAIAELDAEDQA